jgi:hypothetical protein
MNSWRTLIASGLVAGAGLVGFGSFVGAGGRPLSTDLTGLEESPPGDFNASGQADLTLNQGQGEVCFELSWSDVDGAVVAAHIHVGEVGLNGPVVVGLFAGASFEGTDEVSGCVEADRDLIKTIRKNPTAYYVNVHSSTFPAGAVRGQLGD